MKVERFVEELRKIPIDQEALRAKEISEDYIENLINSYRLKKKDKADYSGTNPVLELVGNYDASKLEIGMVSFDKTIEEGEDYFFFGKVDLLDDLAVNKNLGTIELVAEGSDKVCYKCAGNGARFLDAMIVATAFLEKRSNDDSMYEDEELALKIAEECSEIAGSKSEYRDFYEELLS